MQSIRVVGGVAHVVTKGDANLGSEKWSAPNTSLVGRVVWTAPRVGALVTMLGSMLVRALLLAASVLIVLICGLVALARRRATRVAFGSGAHFVTPRA